MAAGRKQWSEDEQKNFLTAYFNLRLNGQGIFNSKFRAMKETVAKQKHYTELSLKTKSTMGTFLLGEIAKIEQVVLAKKKGTYVEPKAEVEEVTPIALVEKIEPEPRDIGVILDELVKKIRSDIMKDNEILIKSLIHSNFQSVLEYFTDPTVPKQVEQARTVQLDEVVRRKKILIVGLLDKQLEIIKRHFPKLRLTNIESQHTSKLSSACVQADMVIIMTDWVGHDADALVVKHATSWVRVKGTITRLREFLECFE